MKKNYSIPSTVAQVYGMCPMMLETASPAQGGSISNVHDIPADGTQY